MPMERILPSEQLSKRIKQLVQALGKVAEENLERGYYERRDEGQEEKGYRKGYKPGKIRTGEGELVEPRSLSSELDQGIGREHQPGGVCPKTREYGTVSWRGASEKSESRRLSFGVPLSDTS